MVQHIMTFELILFVFGWLYGALRGNEKMYWFLRALCGGIFFALFWISLPALLIYELKK